MLCPDDMKPFCLEILAGEYDVPYFCDKPTILDIGANCGAFSVWALRKWPGAKIHCYEPSLSSFEYLEANLSGQAELNRFALGDTSRTQLFRGKANSGQTSFTQWYAGTDEVESVETKSSLIVPEAQIIKIDTEMCECEILLPLLSAGRKYDIILFEYHSEDDRRKLDAALGDYVLCGAKLFHPHRGVLKYFYNKLPTEIR